MKLTSINIDVLSHGFYLQGFNNGPECRAAYSNLDDLLMGLGELLEPEKPGYEALVPIARKAMGMEEDLQRMCGGATLDANGNPGPHKTKAEHDEDDGWRVWEGEADRPPRLGHLDLVEVRFRAYEGIQPADKVMNRDWLHSGSRTDIVAYRVVKP